LNTDTVSNIALLICTTGGKIPKSAQSSKSNPFPHHIHHPKLT